MIELKVKVRDEHTSLTDFHVLYTPVTLTRDDPTLQKLVADSLAKFKSESTESPDIRITCKLVWQ